MGDTVGLDIGTTNVKAVLLDGDLNPVASASVPLRWTRYGEVAEFAQGDHTNLPPADIIVTSHTMEHVSDDQDVVRALRERCRVLYVVVPYREHPLKKEHLRAYDEGTYDAIGPDARAVYPAFPFWTWEIFRDHRLKNLVRPLLGRRRVPVPMAIMYRFGSHD